MALNVSFADADSVPVRDAATVMLVRDGLDGVEVFMLRRNLQSDFVGGAYVFPGGGVDDEDSSVDLAALSVGLDDATASALLGLDEGGLRFWVAAIRESFEEAGLLLALHPDGAPVSFADPEVARRFGIHRSDVDGGHRLLLDIVRDEQLRLATASMHYFSRWITPLGSPRRYDTRFFVAHAPVGQIASHDNRETIANLWIRPQDALDRFAAGEYELIFPTVRSLEALAQFDTAAAVVEYVKTISEFPPLEPRFVEEDGGLRLILPSDVAGRDAVYDPITAERIR